MSLAGVAMLIISEALAFPLAHIFVGYDEKLLEMTVHGFRIFHSCSPCKHKHLCFIILYSTE